MSPHGSKLEVVRGTFRHMMEKDHRKSNLKLIFPQKKTEMRKNNNKGEIRICPKIVAQLYMQF